MHVLHVDMFLSCSERLKRPPLDELPTLLVGDLHELLGVG